MRRKTESGRITAEQLARKIGISAMTVSRALNNHPHVSPKTRKKVLDTAQRMGYSPDLIAKSLAIRKTHTIGVVVPEITHSFFPEAIRGIEEVTYNQGYHLILMHSAENAERERDALQTLESKRVDGILISTAQNITDHEPYKQIIKNGTSLVFFDRCVWGIGASCVGIDDENSAKRITAHLLAHRYTRIAHLAGSSKLSISKARLNGFRKALRERRISVDEDLIVESGLHEEGGYEAMIKILNLPVKKWPRAVVAVNDPAAFGAMRAISEHSLRIPEDIAIVGFSDDIRAGILIPPLTTVRQPAFEVGRMAAQKLFAHIKGKEKKPNRHEIQTELIIRRSCGCLFSPG
jgi:DNA-binding LacI/PurR family transcriptional regulator